MGKEEADAGKEKQYGLFGQCHGGVPASCSGAVLPAVRGSCGEESDWPTKKVLLCRLQEKVVG